MVGTDLTSDPVKLRRAAMRANVRASVSHLRYGSEVIERLSHDDGLAVIGAELNLDDRRGELLRQRPSRLTVDGCEAAGILPTDGSGEARAWRKSIAAAL